MLIKKIELKNFMCFHGDTNVFEFTDGLNVIIGDNGYGKSKLYDAFHWVLYDEIFDATKKQFIKTKFVKENLVSDKAKFDSTGRIECSVKITFINYNDDLYALERKYFVNNNKGNLISANNSTIDFSRKEKLLLNFRLLKSEEDKERVLKNILPDNIKPYMWFQGEQVESIIDFGESTSLTRAIDVLSNISEYDKISEIAEQLAKSSEKEYGTERKKYLKDKDKSDELEEEKNDLEQKLSSLSEEELTLKNTTNRLKQDTEKLLLKLEDSTEINRLEVKKKSIYDDIESLSNEVKLKRISLKKKLFNRNWILKGTSQLQAKFADKYSNYQSNRLSIIAEAKAKEKIESEVLKKLQTRLPINVPEPIYVQKMLDEEKCLVCDRDAKKDSSPWKKIKELLRSPDDTSTSEVTPLFKNDFSRELKMIYQIGLGLKSNINNIDNEISEELKSIDLLDSRLNELDELKESTIQSLNQFLDKVGLNEGEAIDIVNEYRIKQRKYEEEQERFNITKQMKEACANKLKSINAELDNLITGQIDKNKIDKKNILSDFHKIAIETRENVFEDLIRNLENEANAHYKILTSGNKSARGIIRLKKQPNGNYMPELNDENDIPISGFNTGNMIAIKLSVIMAIISAKSVTEGVDRYTLIADAPTSVFGEDYTVGFCKTVSKVYRQSIVMSKEFYRNLKLREELLTNPEIKLGKVYIIEPSIKESERVNRNNLTTNIKVLN